MGLLPEETMLEKTRAPQPSWQHCFQEPDHGSKQQGNRHRPGQHEVIQTYEGKVQAIQKEERMPPTATKKDLARTPGSQARQPEEDQYHTVSLPGGSSTFNHIDSLRKDTPIHTLKTHLVRLEKPQRGIIRSLDHHRHTDIQI